MNPLSDDAKGRAQVSIRSLDEQDIPAAMRLKELAHWNQTESDWRRLLKLDPQGCFAAGFDGHVVATTTSTAYEAELAWIGMVLVDPGYRRRGIATQLMRAALDGLRARGVATVKLDATPAGRRVYEELGFVHESLIERWQGIARPAAATGCAVLSRKLWSELLALDRQAFGADRSTLLDSLAAGSCVAPLIVSAPNGNLRGYALARRGTTACYVGPLVATDEQAAVTLLDGMLTQLAGRNVYVDFNTSFRVSAEILARRGFIKQRDLIRMRYGRESGAGTSPSIFAIAGPEVG